MKNFIIVVVVRLTLLVVDQKEEEKDSTLTTSVDADIDLLKRIDLVEKGLIEIGVTDEAILEINSISIDTKVIIKKMVLLDGDPIILILILRGIDFLIGILLNTESPTRDEKDGGTPHKMIQVTSCLSKNGVMTKIDSEEISTKTMQVNVIVIRGVNEDMNTKKEELIRSEKKKNRPKEEKEDKAEKKMTKMKQKKKKEKD